MVNEAVYTLYEVGSVEAIDTAMSSARITRWDPRARRFHRARQPAFRSCKCFMKLADSKYRPCPLLVKYVEAAGSAERRSAAFTIITEKNRSRPLNREISPQILSLRERSVIKPSQSRAMPAREQG